MAANPNAEDRWITLEERVQAGLGWFALRQHQASVHEYTWELHLDEYQSRCHRQWLDYRWRLCSLAGSELQLKGRDMLEIRCRRTFDSSDRAQQAFEQWIEGLLNELDVVSAERA
ncbi:MAG TPA: hypothetical protein VGE55_08930 [Limnobacter sp.]|uniref:hypothetical protein n=1 Tax=Limnobacter sp. TaxID=2003368 RepID=UPI002EDB0CC6